MKSDGNINSVDAGGGYVVVRMILGGILLVAAGLKAYQLATEPAAEISLMTSRWFLVGVVEFEVLLGLCLIAGVLSKPVWLVTLGCFSVFTCATLYKALTGEASCGCFGSVHVNPWYTLGLDVAAVFALLRWRPALFASAEPTGESRLTGPPGEFLHVEAVVVVVVKQIEDLGRPLADASRYIFARNSSSSLSPLTSSAYK